MRATVFIATAASALALSSCGARLATASGASAICTPFAPVKATTQAPAGQPAIAAPLATADPASALDDCLHRWSYALAASSDDATHVSQAAMAACDSTLARWNQGAAGGPDGGQDIQAPSLITGQPTSPIAQHLSFAQDRALFYVVQARAGHCAAPPMKDGVPEGLTRE